MRQIVVPTTRAQVSGHRFLQRRVEHGLVFGDIRMIHDPLATRHRALIFGVVAVVVIGLGAGLLAWLRPEADPGEAPVLRTSDGALFVRVDDRVHPVANLASARLVVGEAVEPAGVGGDVLAGLDRGVPLGIHPAPLVLGDGPGELPWAVCTDPDGTVTVVAGDVTAPPGGHHAVLATGGGADWILDTHGRRQLPPPDSREGRAIRRVLRITSASPRWEPPAEVLTVVAEQEPFTVPGSLPEEVLAAGTRLWARLPGGIAPVTETQAAVLGELGVGTRTVESVADEPDAEMDLPLPTHEPLWIDPAQVPVCAAGEGGVAVLPPGAHRAVQAVPLPGAGVADEFLLPDTSGAALAVDSGHGYHVIDTTGLRHPVPDLQELEALGLRDVLPAPWPVIRLLPEGPELSGTAARRPAF